MKKITESQLKDKVNSLREYLKVYENQQVDEWSMLSPSSWFNGRDYGDSTSRDDVRSQDAAKNSTAGANMALVQHREQLAPGSVASETGKDGVTYAVDAKGMRTFKIENGKWVAMATPTPAENPELAAAPEAPAQAASVTPTAPSTQDLTAAASASGEAVGKSLQRFKELLAKAKAPATATAAAPAAAQSPYALQANGAKLKANESTDYFLKKLRLIESHQLNEDLTAEEQKELDTLAQSYGDSEDPEIAGLMKQYSDVKNAALNATPAPAAQVTPAAPAVRPPVAVDPRDGAVGKSLASMGVSKQDRLNQAFVDSTLGAGKYKAGSAESNMALQAYFKKQSGGQGASVTPVTPPTAPTAPTAPAAPKLPGNYEKVTAPPTGIVPGQNARDDLLARQGKGQKTIDLSNSSRYTDGTPRVKESVGYNELQRIVSLVNHR
jgi:hypothetical protein